MTPASKYQERHYDYVQTVGTLPAGALRENIPFQLGIEAPFQLRSRAARVAPTAASINATPVQAGLNGLKIRFAGPDGRYYEQQRLRFSLLAPYFGQYGNPIPNWPPVNYPRGGVILMDLENAGSVDLVGLQLFWRGVEIYPAGSIPAYTYPAKMAALPYLYPQTISALPVTTPTVGLRQVFQPLTGGDFVFRMGQAGRSSAPFAFQVSIQMRDQDAKAYSNDFVPVDILFGKGAPPAAFEIGPTPSHISPIGTGPSSPGLWYPEIYVPDRHVLLYDVLRDDSAYAGAAACDFPIAFNGMKVQPKP